MAVRFERAVPEGSPAECQWTPHLQEGRGICFCASEWCLSFLVRAGNYERLGRTGIQSSANFSRCVADQCVCVAFHVQLPCPVQTSVTCRRLSVFLSPRADDAKKGCER